MNDRLARVSELLGVVVVQVRRNRPAHERLQWDHARHRYVPATEWLGLGSERVARQRWLLNVRQDDGTERWTELTSEQVRERVRCVTDEPKAGRTCLRLLHELNEQEAET